MPAVSGRKKLSKTFERLLGKMEHKICSIKNDYMRAFRIFSCAKRGLVCASNLEKVMMQNVPFCSILSGLKLDLCMYFPIPNSCMLILKKNRNDR